jgi:hypothetical protein
MNTRKLRYLPALTLLLVVSGCGSSLLKVTGRVTYKGEPVPSTMLTFHPEEEGKRASHGITDDDGNFKLSYSSSEMGAVRGKHTVTLRYHLEASEEMGKTKPKASKELKDVIARYGDLKTSKLHYEVTENGQFIEIKLE